MKVEMNKEILFEKLNKKETDDCSEEEDFLEILKKEIEDTDIKRTSLFVEKKRNKSRNDIFDTLIDI